MNSKSAALKARLSYLHDEVEALSPIVNMMDRPFEAGGEAKLRLFSSALEPVWTWVAGFELPAGFESLGGVAASLYPDFQPHGKKTSKPHWMGTAYVLLGSSMGSAYLYKSMLEKGYVSVEYFLKTKNVAPLFLALKKEIEQSSATEFEEIELGARSAYQSVITAFEKASVNS